MPQHVEEGRLVWKLLGNAAKCFPDNWRRGRLCFSVVRRDNVVFEESCVTDRKIQNVSPSYFVEQDPVCQTLFLHL